MTLLHWIKRRIFQYKGEQVNTASVTSDIDLVPRYPPPRRHWPFMKAGVLLHNNEFLLLRIRIELDFSVDEFDVLVQPVLIRYAEMVQLLPSTDNHHHFHRGGMLEHGLEVGFWMLRLLKDNPVKVVEVSAEEDVFDKHLKLAAFFCGLLHDVGKVCSAFTITAIDEDEKWSPCAQSLWRWGETLNTPGYLPSWLDKQDPGMYMSANYYLAIIILNSEVLSHFESNGQSDLFGEILPATEGGNRKPSCFAELLRLADQRSVDLNLKDQWMRFAGKLEDERRG